MNEKPYKQKVSISLDEDLIKIIKNLAEEDERSFSQYINMVLRKWALDPNNKPKNKA